MEAVKVRYRRIVGVLEPVESPLASCLQSRRQGSTFRDAIIYVMGEYE